MTERGKKYLSDILQAIELVEAFLEGIDDFASYVGDLKTQSAVERQLGIIGEAVNRFRQSGEADALPQSREIVGFRNRLIHQYDGLDEAIVWSVVHEHLPLLKEEARRGLALDGD